MNNFIEETEKYLEKMRNLTGKPCRKEVLKEVKLKLKNQKEETRWTVKIIKRLEKLVRKNPDTIYIYDYTDLEGCIAEGNPASWIDVHIALPFSFGRFHSIWVFTLLTKKCHESDMEYTVKNGGEVFKLEEQFRSDQFDNLYLDIEGFKTEQDIIDGFKAWAKIFIPEIADKKIVYKNIESFFLKEFISNLFKRSTYEN